MAESGVTAVYTMRGACVSKRYVGVGVGVGVGDDDKDDPNEMFFGDSWFSSVESTCKLWNRFKCRYAGILKTNHSRFPKVWIERTIKDWPTGSHIVLERRATRVCHKGAGSTECTDFYEAKWKDANGNTESR